MRVLVTGHCGFVGRHVAEVLIERQHSVLGWDRVHPVRPRELNRIVLADLRGVDSVIHCAAHADVRNNWEDGQMVPLVDDNLIAMLILLECCARAPSVKRFVFVSTGAVYAASDSTCDEGHSYRCTSPYTASKLSGEAFVQAYAERWGWQACIARPAAAFGRGYTHGHVADFVKQAKEQKFIFGLDSGAPPRAAVHVRDLAESLATMGTGDVRAGVYNIASEERWSWKDTAQLMGMPVVHRVRPSGWVGDGQGAVFDTGAAERAGMACVRSISIGVAQALNSLGYQWPTSRARWGTREGAR